jgi:hypothetical protein
MDGVCAFPALLLQKNTFLVHGSDSNLGNWDTLDDAPAIGHLIFCITSIFKLVVGG